MTRNNPRPSLWVKMNTPPPNVTILLLQYCTVLTEELAWLEVILEDEEVGSDRFKMSRGPRGLQTGYQHDADAPV